MDPLIKTEGIFRINPRARMVDVLVEAYDRGQKFIVWREGNFSLSYGHMRQGIGNVFVEDVDHTEGYELHVAAGLIKHWYKELREPIFPHSCYAALEKFYGATYSETERPLQVCQMLDILSTNEEWSPISKRSREILTMHLLPLLSRVTDFQDWNQMTAYNLAVCFAPCLLHGPDPAEDVKISSIVRRMLMAMIMHWKSDLAPHLDMDEWKFQDSLRLPEAPCDREDPPQEASGPPTSLEAQVSGITLIDNTFSDVDADDDDNDDGDHMDELETPPPLPPRPAAATAAAAASASSDPGPPTSQP